jgi:hypothetical protein
VNLLASYLPPRTCRRCGQDKPIEQFNPDRTRKDGYRNYCRTCAREYVRDWKLRHPDKVKEYNRLSRSGASLTVEGRAANLWHQAKRRSKNRGLEFSIDKDWVIAGIRRGQCSLTGVRFDLAPTQKYHYNPRAPSLDRRDSKQGYTPDNVRIVCMAMNLALHEFGEEFFELLARGYLRRIE